METNEILDMLKQYIENKLIMPTLSDYEKRVSSILDFECDNNLCDKGIYFILDGNEKVYYIGQSGFRKNRYNDDTSLAKRTGCYSRKTILTWLQDESEPNERDKFDEIYYQKIIRKEWKIKILFMPHITTESDARLIEDFCVAQYRPLDNGLGKRNKGVSVSSKIFEILHNTGK